MVRMPFAHVLEPVLVDKNPTKRRQILQILIEERDLVVGMLSGAYRVYDDRRP